MGDVDEVERILGNAHRVHGGAFLLSMTNTDMDTLRSSVARLQEENRQLREEGIRDAMRILFGECEWSWGYEDDALILHYPPGFALPLSEDEEDDFDSRIPDTAMADAFTEALLPLVP